jgi:putative adhesin
VQVQKGTRLDINNFAGDVSIKVWDKDAVRVQVSHSDRETIDIKPVDQSLLIRSHSSRGPQRSLDYQITVPRWMAIVVNGMYADVTLEGVGGDVTVDTNRGDIKVIGGTGFMSLKSMQGDIDASKFKGRIEVKALNQDIHLADIAGDVSAESTNGSLVLDRIDSGNVDLYTVNGSISYDGPIKDKGIYRLTTHNGTIFMALPEKVNVTLMVRTYNGGFKSTFPVKLEDQNPRKRFTLTYGDGSARVELESFGGTIALRRPGEARPETERRGLGRGRGLLQHERGDADDSETIGDAIADSISQSISEAVADSISDSISDSIQHAMEGAMAHAGFLASKTIRIHPVPMPQPRPRIDPRIW